MKSRFAYTYYCQKCDHEVKTKRILIGEKCDVCESGFFDDRPTDADMNSDLVGKEGELDHFNRYVAGDHC